MAFLSMLLVGGCEYDTTFTSSSATQTFDESSPYIYQVDETGNSLKIFNYSNPSSVTTVSTTSTGTGTGPRAPRLVGTRLYVPYKTSGELAIWDVSNPASPSELGKVGLSGFIPTGVAVSGNTAIVSLRFTGGSTTQAKKIDVSNPASPSVTSNWSYNGANLYSCQWVEIVGDQCLFALGLSPSASKFVSVSLSTFPASGVSSEVNIPNGPTIGRFAVNPDDLYAYVVGGSGLALSAVDISNASSLSISSTLGGGSIWGGSSNSPDNTLAYRAVNEHVYWGHFNGADLRVARINVSNPASMTVTGYYSSGGDQILDTHVTEDDCTGLIYCTSGGFFLKGSPS